MRSSAVIGIMCLILSSVLFFTPLLAQAQTLSPNLLFTSLQPCRLVDTRMEGGAVMPGAAHARAFDAVGVSAPGSLSAQGGNPSGCPVPGFSGFPQVQAVLLNITVAVPAGTGDLRAWSSDQPAPNASIINFASGQTIANAVVVPVRQDHQGGDFTVQADVSATNVVADVLGYFSAYTPTAGQDNLFLGLQSGNAATTGLQNTAVGLFTLRSNTSGQQNVALGTSALTSNLTGLANTAVGVGALQNNLAGFHNTAVGMNSLSAANSANSNNNTAIGLSAMAASSSGSNNTAVGVGALDNNTSGSSDIAVGFNAGSALNGGESFDIDLGSTGVAGESDAIRIGTVGTQTAAFVAGISGSTSASGIAVLVNSSGQLGTTTSSIRFKEDVATMGAASDDLMQLRPVTFHYRAGIDDGSHLLQYGLVAEEVAQVFPDLVQYGEDGRPLAVRYHFVNAMLLNEVQKQHRKVEDQEASLASQRREISTLQTRLAAEESRAAELSRQMTELHEQLQALRDRLDTSPGSH